MKINSEARRIVQALQQAYVPNDAYDALAECFEMLLSQRRADVAAGLHTNVRGIVLVGRSGSGKSTAFRELLLRTKGLNLGGGDDGFCEVVSLQVPSPATLKFVGTAALQALGFPLARDKSAALIWGQVKDHLKRRKTLFLHLDEAQDLTRYQTQDDRDAVVRTLKSLMENSEWPVGLILSGMPELADLVNADAQLARRLYPIAIERLNPLRSVNATIDMLQLYAKRGGVEVDSSLLTSQFAARLMHAADYEFGLLTEFVVQALGMSLQGQGQPPRLLADHFAGVYRMRSGAPGGLNPFVAEDFERIDVRRLMGDANDSA